MEELSQNAQLAVPEELSETANEMLGRSDLESSGSAEAVVDRVSRDPEALGLVPLKEVGPKVKALTVDGETLLEPGASDPEGYPLRPEGATDPEVGESRRIVVAGDIVLDRGQNYTVIQQDMGLDFPLDGGYAAITGRTAEESDASEFGIIHQFTAERRGEAGQMREYLRSADLTLANFENPVVADAVWHPDAATFTGDLRLLPILRQAGIDGVTLGNNHILDAGIPGLAETIGHLRDAGISYTGAGMDLASTREPMVFDLGETRVGVLNYQGVPSYDWSWATESAPGTAPLQADIMLEDVERLRPEVDLLVVMPHWGNEYLATPRTGAGRARARGGGRGRRSYSRQSRPLAQGHGDVPGQAYLLRDGQLPLRSVLVRGDFDRNLRGDHPVRRPGSASSPRTLPHPRQGSAELPPAGGRRRASLRDHLRRVSRPRV
jgi:poly-gamma-glutamate synthesis protein (capsule biosynthesis protein)